MVCVCLCLCACGVSCACFVNGMVFPWWLVVFVRVCDCLMRLCGWFRIWRVMLQGLNLFVRFCVYLALFCLCVWRS